MCVSSHAQTQAAATCLLAFGAGFVAVGSDGTLLLLHLLTLLESFQQQQRTQSTADADADEDSQLCTISPTAAEWLPS